MGRIALVMLLLLMSLPADGEEAQPAAAANYAEALWTADLFLEAWARRDSDLGLSLLSPRLWRESRRDSTEVVACLRQYFQGLSNPHHVSFEIGAGTPRGGTRYAFPVVLFECYSGERAAYRFADTLEVQQIDQVWRVDRVPRPECGE